MMYADNGGWNSMRQAMFIFPTKISAHLSFPSLAYVIVRLLAFVGLSEHRRRALDPLEARARAN